MGWSGGSQVLSDVAVAYSGTHRKWGNEAVNFFNQVIDSLEMQDADTLDECFGIYEPLDEALKEMGYGAYD